ncbi:MAG TPA: LytTR family DNA-binding domain-containing protein [Thermoanaerobaculia bacterium]|jgi:two-component system LytT family response regulator|nr:LytTR family DNA-binding domain-containing protein [Thermoanaerobaculia bacterium]
MRLRTLIVDDERLARQKLRTLLQRHSDVELVGECADGEAALADIERLRPDLVFLDIRMPGRSGLEVVRVLQGGAPPHVVFVTAHGDHAVEAFELEAVDYLLKPFDRSRLERALQRARRRLAEPAGSVDRLAALLARLEARLEEGDLAPAPAPPAAATAPLLPERLAVRLDGRTLLVPTEDLDWVEAVGNYVRLHTRGGRYLHRETLTGLEGRLDPTAFLRIHRGALVNARRIREIQPGVGDEHIVILTDGTRLALSRRYRARLRARGVPL